MGDKKEAHFIEAPVNGQTDTTPVEHAISPLTQQVSVFINPRKKYYESRFSYCRF